MYPRYEKLYCCEKDIKIYEDYYVKQVGNGLPVFRGTSFQKGYGIGSVFGSIGQAVLPLLKSGAKAVGKEALKSGTQFLGDILEGNNVKQAAATRAKTAGKNLFPSAVTHFSDSPPGERQRKRKRKTKTKSVKRKRDIFG